MRAYVCNSVGSKSKAAWAQTRKQLYVMRGQMGTAKRTDEVNHENRAVCKQSERGVYMMQAMTPICGLVDGVNERFSNETECCQREESSQYSWEKSSNKCAKVSAPSWPVVSAT